MAKKNTKSESLPVLTLFDTSHNLLLASEITVTYRHKIKPSLMPKLVCSKDSADVLRMIWSDRLEHVEEFVVICLNRANRMLGWAKVSSGGLSGTVADPKLIFQIALKSNASSIILAHNHPSGNPSCRLSIIANARRRGKETCKRFVTSPRPGLETGPKTL